MLLFDIIIYLIPFMTCFIYLTSHIIYSILILILVLFIIAICIIFLQAEFISLILILIYIGALNVLFLFVLMIIDFKKLFLYYDI